MTKNCYRKSEKMNSIQINFYAHIFRNSRRQKGDMKPVEYSEHFNISYHLTKCILPSDMVQLRECVFVGWRE